MCEPLKERVGDYLVAIAVYGSAVRGDWKSGSDIDILVLLDDTEPGFNEAVIAETKSIISEIERSEDRYKLHFQPPKILSQWWKLLIEGEPWALTSMKDAKPIYDPDDYINRVQTLVSDSDSQEIESRSRRLIARSKENVEEIERLLLEDTTSEILSAMSDAAEAVLDREGERLHQDEEIPAKLNEVLVEKGMMSEEVVDDFSSFHDFSENIMKRGIEDISVSEFEEHMDRAVDFIHEMHEIFEKIEEREKSEIIQETYSSAIELCREGLEKEIEEVPESGNEVIARFKEVFVDNGRLSDEYLDLLEKLSSQKEKKEAGDLEDVSMESISIARSNISDLRSALNDITTLRSDESLTIPDQDLQSEQSEALREFADQLLTEFSDEVKAIWVQSVEEVEITAEVSIFLLYDDFGDSGVSVQEIERSARRMAVDMESKYGLAIHPNLYTLTEYWNLIIHRSPIIFEEIREGDALYDPAGFFRPMKNLLVAGEIKGTREFLQEKLERAPRRIMKVE
ncbi:MAG: nucleotidyltransferase domain-containing protein, partial [Candidatus Aenigmatarchaeota archaeon]